MDLEGTDKNMQLYKESHMYHFNAGAVPHFEKKEYAAACDKKQAMCIVRITQIFYLTGSVPEGSRSFYPAVAKHLQED
jgi:hypothetical protein